MKFETCPRCGNAWDVAYPIKWVAHGCSACRMTHDSDYLRLRFGEDLGVTWYPGYNKTIIRKLSKDEAQNGYRCVEGTEIEINMLLPYDITKERLQLLLTFS